MVTRFSSNSNKKHKSAMTSIEMFSWVFWLNFLLNLIIATTQQILINLFSIRLIKSDIERKRERIGTEQQIMAKTLKQQITFCQHINEFVNCLRMSLCPHFLHFRKSSLTRALAPSQWNGSRDDSVVG